MSVVADSQELTERYEFAQIIAREAGDVTLRYFQTSIDVDRKGDGTPVTIADRQAELHLRERIAARFPEDAILGEEHGEKTGTSGFRWILDPIDGTKSFVAGVPLYTTLIGVLQHEVPQIGVIAAPALGALIHAQVGKGAWYEQPERNAVQALVSQCDRLADALFLTSERATFDERNAGDAYRQLEAATRLTRTWGDAYGYLLVATGRAELMVDAILSVWDAAAVLPVVTEAGGTFTDWQGEQTIFAQESIGTNGPILAEVLAITREFPPIGSD